MKNKKLFAALLTVLFSMMAAGSFSFTGKKGGDVLEVYVNGRMELRQFLHLDKSVKTLELASFNSKDNIDIFYSHCGYAGKSRMLTIRDEKNALVKEWKFPDAGNHSAMRFSVKDILPAKSKSLKVNVYYASKEMPEARLLVTIGWKEQKATARL